LLEPNPKVTWAQKYQTQGVAAIERQVHNAAIVDNCAYRGIFGGEQRSAAGDFDRLGYFTDCQGEIDTGGLLYLQLDSLARHHPNPGAVTLRS
jgi:hypothetical protein